jgi:hypothetical protein
LQEILAQDGAIVAQTKGQTAGDFIHFSLLHLCYLLLHLAPLAVLNPDGAYYRLLVKKTGMLEWLVSCKFPTKLALPELLAARGVGRLLYNNPQC